MNVTICRDIAPCAPYVNRRFGGSYHPHPPYISGHDNFYNYRCENLNFYVAVQEIGDRLQMRRNGAVMFKSKH
jgi:hypothetical protein